MIEKDLTNNALKSFFYDSPISIEQYDKDGSFLDCNATCLNLFGMTETSQAKDYNLFEDRNLTNEQIMEIRSGKSIRFEIKYDFDQVKKNNSFLTSKIGISYLDIFIISSKSEDNEISGYILYSIDITEQKKAEQKLIESEERYRKLYENTKDPIYILYEGSFVDCNQAALDALLIKSKNDFFKMKPWEISPEIQPDGRSSKEKAKEMIKIALNKGFHQFDWVHKNILDENRWYNVSLTKMLLNGQTILYTVWRDIDERKQKEEELKSMSKKLSKAQSIGSVGYFEWDMIEDFVSGSEQYFEIFGTNQSNHNSFIDFENSVHYEDREKVKLALDKAIKNSEYYDVEYRIILNEDIIKHIHALGEFEFDDDEKPVYLLGMVHDITKQKEIENLLLAREQHLNAILNASHVGITLNKNLVLVFVNQYMCKLVGYDFEEIINKKSSHFYASDEEFELVGKNLSIGLKEDKSVLQETRLKTKSGDLINVLMHSSYYNGKDDKDGIISVVTDITEQKHLIKALKESEEKFRTFTEKSPSAISIFKDLNSYFYVNPAWCNLSGYCEDELKDIRPLDIVHPDMHEFVYARFEERLNDNDVQNRYDLKCIDKNGKVIWTDFFVTEIVYDGQKAFLSVAYDISDKKKAEEEVNLFFNTALDMLCIAGFDGYFKKLSPTWSHVLGWSEEELLSKPFIDFVHPEDKDITNQALAGLKDGSNILGFENRYICKDGSFRWISWNTKPVSDRNIIIAAARDITSNKKYEEAMLELNTELEDRVLERTNELEKAYEKIETALTKEKELGILKTRFMNMISHEYRTPLTVISSSADIIDLYIKNNELDKVESQFLKINTSIKALTHLIEDVLAFSNSNDELIECCMVPIDIEKYCQEIIDEMLVIDTGNHKYDLVYNSKLNSIMNDKRYLRQILMQILINAMKYSPQETQIKLIVEDDNDTITFSIVDNGVGISDEDQKNVFSPFFKSEKHIGIKSGTGLGLAIVKRYVDALKGKLTVESKIGVGSTFSVTFPL